MTTDFNKLKVVDLKAELKSRGLPQNGLKAELVARLEAAEAAAAAVDTEVAESAESAEPAEPVDAKVEETTVSASEEQPAPASAPEPEPKPESESEAVPESEPVPQPKPEVESVPVPVLEPEAEAQPAEKAAEELTTQDVSDDVKQSEQSPGVVGPANSNESVQDQLPDPPTAQEFPSAAVPDAQDQLVHPSQSPDIPPAPPVEAGRDSQKRKRRSGSPPPSGEDISRKRARQDEDGDNSVTHKTISPVVEGPDVDMEDATGERSAEQDDRESAGRDHIMEASQEEGAQGSSASELPGAGDALPTHEDATTSAHEVLPDQQPEANAQTEPERDIEPAIHPATSALYIKHFMRPLRPQAVQDHLLQLAAPAGVPVDESTIVDFYLDTIRTHAFVVFNSVSAASRVRTALHDRIWPDETNRKPLWVDFVPPECFADWVDMEQGSSGGRGSTSRYEVSYENDEDGHVVAKLREAGAAPPAAKRPPSQPPQPERKLSIPTGPSRPYQGVEGAPLGPRGFQQGGRGAQVHSSRLESLSDDVLETRAHPIISYKPVSDELAERRLSTLSGAKTRDQNRDFGKDYKRYYFENGDFLVDRGPEIFLGIRPPHRERERRREQGGGRRGGGGGGGRRGGGRRGGPPIYHGVPRGGDRFRPSGSSSAYDRSERYRGSNYDRY